MSDVAAGVNRMPEPAHGEATGALAPEHPVRYFTVFVTLVVMTVVTVVVAFLGISVEWQKVCLALAIAFFKASLVVLYFMHMKFEGKLIYLILLVPLAFCIMLVMALLPDVSFAPYLHDATFAAWKG